VGCESSDAISFLDYPAIYRSSGNGRALETTVEKRTLGSMPKQVAEWNEDDVLSLPVGENDTFEH